MKKKGDGWGRPTLNLRRGEWAEVKLADEIAATLQEDGTFEGVPFLSEMEKFCGRRFKVLKPAKKMIIEESALGMRQLKHAVILDGVDCSGEFHGGCQRTCRLLWKEAWLRRPSSDTPVTRPIGNPPGHRDFPQSSASEDGVYRCQSTCLIKATSPLARWDARQYVWDITSGTYRPLERLNQLLKSGLNRVLRMLHRKSPEGIRGRLTKTPAAITGLRAGDIVEVKSREEILETLDSEGKNRGLVFTAEMLRYCGQRYPVLKRVDKMINEASGRMRALTNTVILDSCTCDGKAHGGCQRMCYSCWREIWLRKVS
jgi:hypothetical protein